MRDHTHRLAARKRDRTRVRGPARQGEAGFGFAIDGNGRRDPATPGSTTCDVQHREDSGDRAVAREPDGNGRLVLVRK